MKVTLTVIKGPHQGRVFTFSEHDNFIVGRGKQAHCRLPIEDKYFSRHHFLVEVNPPRCRLLDLCSTNGTRVNDRKVQSVDLHDGDLIKGGITTIRVAIQEYEAASTLAKPKDDSDRPGPKEDRALGSEPEPPPGLEPEPAWSRFPVSTQVLAESPRTPEAPACAGLGVEPACPLDSPTWRPPGCGPEVSQCRVCGKSVTDPWDGPEASVCSECRDQIGRQDQPIGGYRIVRELGRGGMGVVYLALREQDANLVALKAIVPEVTASRTDVKRFLREADILRQLDHPHIVSFRGMGEASGRIYFAMDYVPGIDAARLLRDHGPLPIPRAVDLACQMLEALEYAHGRKFVHRDIKPSNLMVKQVHGPDFALLADFGLARVYQASRMSGLTMTGDFAGTPAYMAPEQLTHFREATPASDIYSAGATLYSLLTGCCVIDLPRRMDQALLKILQEDPVPIHSRRQDIPSDLARDLHRSLSRDPRKRFSTAGAMREALTKHQGR